MSQENGEDGETHTETVCIGGGKQKYMPRADITLSPTQLI